MRMRLGLQEEADRYVGYVGYELACRRRQTVR